MMTSIQSALMHNLNAHSLGVLGFAFLGGLASSLLPCMLSMLPILVGYVGAYGEDSKWEVLRQVSLFITGLAIVMTVLGVAASLLGLTFGSLIGSGFYYAIGIFSILIALHLLHVIQIPLPKMLTRLPESKSGKFFAPLLLGMAFGITSSPCGTPFLAAILGFISREKNIVLGGASLFFYAVGQGSILLIAGMFTGLLKHIAKIRHVSTTINHLSAGIFLIMGVMLIAAGAGWLQPAMQALHLF